MLNIQPELKLAISKNEPVVALETALLSLGLPFPDNVEVFNAMSEAVRAAGALPAGIAVHDGRVHVGLDAAIIDHFARATTIKKCARRDLGWILGGGHSGATTVSSTLYLAHCAGITVFATGGIGGVHPAHDGPPDISADIATMSQIPALVVSTGTKSICDAAATAELLEAFSVPVIGLGTDRFPHFYAGPSKVPIPRIDSPADAARAYRAHREIGLTSTLLVANPAPEEHRLDPVLLARMTNEGTTTAAREGITGNALTPYLLAHLAQRTKNKSVIANRALLIHNAATAAAIAVELASKR